MIKTHNVTGLKYLCITKQDDWRNYPGSGLYWTRHLKKHGYDFSTELLFESEDYEEFVEKCAYYSIYYDVVLNEEFANLKPELGYDGFTGFWMWATEETKREIYKRRGEGLKRYWAELPEEERKKRSMISSEASKKYWAELPLDDRRKILEAMWFGARKMLEEKGVKYDEWRKKISLKNKGKFGGMFGEELSSFNKHQRLNLSPEKKAARKEKILQWHEEHIEERRRLYERYSEERQGINNPAAKKILWYDEVVLYKDKCLELGEEYVKSILGDVSIPNCRYLFDPDRVIDYGELTCPYCAAYKEPTKKPSAFKRWHFENCKKKVEAESEDR